MAGISVVSVVLLLSAVITTVDLALFTDVGIRSCAIPAQSASRRS